MAKASTPRSPLPEPPLTPSRPALRRALVQAARDAKRVADAFNVKVPVEAKVKT